MAEHMNTELSIWLNGKTEILNSSQLSDVLPRFKAPFCCGFKWPLYCCSPVFSHSA